MGKAELLQATNHVLGLHDINLDIPAGQIFVIMGLSGSGKSTLIRHFSRLIEPTDGRILIDGQDILQLGTLDLRELRRRRISMVFQKFGLLPHRTVLDNVAYGRIVGGEPAAVARRKAAEFIGVVGLTGFESHLPSQLSGGMQQRVGLARALATDAEILLMDEAFSALDPLIRTEMQVQLKAIQSQLGKTVVFITHDLDEALYLGDTIAILKDGQLRQVGSGNQILMTPADDYVSRFVRDVNRARVLSCGGLARLQCEGWSTHPAIDAGFPLLIDAARQNGIAALAIRNSYNCGVLGHHAERIASAGLLSLCFTNAPASIAPVGGAKPIIGTNPFALGVPNGAGAAALVIDQSASVVAKSEIARRAAAGTPIPEGWAVDAEGNPTTDAGAALKGAMMPSGGYKGFGIGLMVELFAAAMTGATLGIHASPFSGTSGGPPRTGQFFIACDPSLTSNSFFADRLDALLQAIDAERNARRPGSRRLESRRMSVREGVAISRALLARIEILARS